MKFIEKNKAFLTLLFAMIALFFSGISLFKSCSSESELRKINYSISSIEHRPRIKLSNPQIHGFRFVSDSIIPDNSEKNDSVGNAYGKVDYKIKIRATNIGNTSSKLIGWIVTDTISNELFIKEYIKNRVVLNSDSENGLKFPHLYQELTPFDSCTLELSHRPQWIDDNRFIIHIILFYENELNQLFDTYYWLTVQTKQPVLPSPLYYKNNPEKFRNYKIGLVDIAEIKDENNYSETYTEDEKEEILKKFK
jgi:hypothetical protein